MNKVILIGRLTKEPELRTTSTGVSVVANSIAVNRKFKNQNGEIEADFINFVAFGATAELIGDYVDKGHLLGIEGRIQTRNYQNENGDKVYVTEVVAENIYFLQGKKEQKQETDNYENQYSIEEDDLPF